MKKLVATMLVAVLISLLGISSINAEETTNYGASGALVKNSYSLAEMLTYAIQDEYLARAEYNEIMAKFGAQKPFSNIEMSEEMHISMLKPLFDKYKVPLPEDTAAEHVIIPNTLLEAYKAGVQAEINNIAMYDSFLKQNQPDDVRSVFLKLMYASQNHQSAFENKVAQMEGTSSGGSTGGGRMGMK
ncbi:DUF2202 domain-containing protein [Neobacillus sp. LXY-4]|uniref:DUF2202 domain-containing protein n=1 Tax=Neobacillus sp. LXY-4 TaxID=3379826 RepID=UPI003EE2466D